MNTIKNLPKLMGVTAMLIFLMLFFLFITPNSFAHPGNTASDGCHYCWTNCPSWGEVYGERHCHNEGGYDENYDPPERDYGQEYDSSDYDPGPVEPEEVKGNTSPTKESTSNSNCYIATAVYGTPVAKDIDVLREFRDTSLITNPVGDIFVQTYYKYSPPIANLIAHNEVLKFIIREGEIKPLVNTLKLTKALWDN